MPRSANRKEQQKPEQTEVVRFLIDTQWYEESGHSLVTIVNARRCPSCQSRLARGQDNRDPIAAISECCSKEEAFLQRDLPLLECAFRVILAGGNSPMSGQEIRGRLAGVGFDIITRDLSPERLERMLSRDSFYCFRRIEPEVGAEKVA